MGVSEDHLGIKNRIKKIPVALFPPKNVTLKNKHIDIIAPNFTARFLKYLNLCFSWIAHTHPLLVSLFVR
jgi:hypothetical protein